MQIRWKRTLIVDRYPEKAHEKKGGVGTRVILTYVNDIWYNKGRENREKGGEESWKQKYTKEKTSASSNFRE